MKRWRHGVLIMRQDGRLGILLKARKNGLIQLLMAPDWIYSEQPKERWEVVN